VSLPRTAAPPVAARRVAIAVLAAALALAAGGCAHAPSTGGAPPGHPERGPRAPEPDSATIALWHLDETGGTRAADAGRLRLDAHAGLDTRTDFGRFRTARIFTRSIDSFLYRRYEPVLDTPRGLTVEAWIRVDEYGQYEDTPIAARWTQYANDQSWMLSVLGRNILPPQASLPGPGYHQGFVLHGQLGELMFVFQPEAASPPLAYFSSRPIELGRWTHVAVTYDGEVVRFYLDGLLDSQFAAPGRIRSTHAPLLVGNYFDPRWLTEFGGELRVDTGYDPNPFYAFEGAIDELRISSEARTEYPYVVGR
jgi:hypothetical protein